MPEMHLKQPTFTYGAYVPFAEKKEKKKKKLWEKGHSRYFYWMNYAKTAFSKIWPMEVLKIHLEEQLLINCYTMDHFKLIIIEKMINVKEVMLE